MTYDIILWIPRPFRGLPVKSIRHSIINKPINDAYGKKTLLSMYLDDSNNKIVGTIKYNNKKVNPIDFELLINSPINENGLVACTLYATKDVEDAINNMNSYLRKGLILSCYHELKTFWHIHEVDSGDATFPYFGSDMIRAKQHYIDKFVEAFKDRAYTISDMMRYGFRKAKKLRNVYDHSKVQSVEKCYVDALCSSRNSNNDEFDIENSLNYTKCTKEHSTFMLQYKLARIAHRLGILSLILGLLSVALGICYF